MRTVAALALALVFVAGCTGDRSAHRSATAEPTASSSASSAATLRQAATRYSALVAPVYAGLARLQPEVAKAHPSLAVLRRLAAQDVAAAKTYVAGLEAPGWPPALQTQVLAATREAVALVGPLSELAAAKTLAAAATAVRRLAAVGTAATQRLREALGLPAKHP